MALRESESFQNKANSTAETGTSHGQRVPKKITCSQSTA